MALTTAEPRALALLGGLAECERLDAGRLLLALLPPAVPSMPIAGDTARGAPPTRLAARAERPRDPLCANRGVKSPKLTGLFELFSCCINMAATVGASQRCE
mmetsp:Transcript_3089/g.7704  ORF Transcript_3089/g.7704 Transcript_3089/m.7704 type:complete len:102 (-) Transcript_3089:8-313(-)